MSLHNFGGRQLLVAAVYGVDHASGEVLEGHAAHVVHAHDGLAIITALADASHQRYLPQELNIKFLGQEFATIATKDEVLLIGMSGGSEPRHILDNAQHGHTHVLAHEH